MQTILVKIKLYVTEKNAKNKKKNNVSFPSQTLLKKKNAPPPPKKKIKQFPSRTCSKHSRPVPYYYCPVIAVLQQCADGLATV